MLRSISRPFWTVFVLAVLVAGFDLSSLPVTAQPRSTPRPSSTPSPRVNAPAGDRSESDANLRDLLTRPVSTALPSAGSLPYPAYASPVPGINQGAADPNVPQTVTLAQAVAIGVATSPLLAAARADAQLAKVSVDLARTGYLPNITGTAALTRTLQTGGLRNSEFSGVGTPGPGGTGLITISQQSTSQSVEASIAQLIFDGGRVAAQIQAASRSQVAAVDTYRRDIQTVAYNISTAYYNVLSARRATAVDVQLVLQDQVQENLVRAQVAAGTTAQVDISTAAVPVARARLTVVQSQAQELNSLAVFANTLGLDANTLIAPADDTAVLDVSLLASQMLPDYNRALERALALRPDYDSAYRSVQASERTLVASKLAYVPTITGSGAIGSISTNPQGGAFRPSASVGLDLNVPFFNQGIDRANVEQARANLDLSRANFVTERRNLELSVKQALVGVVSARSAINLANAELTQAVQALNATRAQYRAGVTTLPLLLNAQVALTQAATDRVTFLYSLRQAEVQLLYALGDNIH